MKTNYTPVNPKQSFPEMEKEIIKFWEENNTFEKSMENRKDAEEFNFYDGPPFATGTPHYGHILAGTIKDVIPRYQTMKGKLVKRVFGWDCHGLPIENIVEKKMEISGKDDIMKVGVHNFNESCRANVSGYVDDWKKTVKRMGRWVDMENSYKTMDTNFMETIWWVYKSLYDKGLIYEGHRVVPYCPRCTTPLSNFEVNQGYKDKQDKTLTIKFKVIGNENKYILAWTTTPWTLMANLGLAVGENILYSEILDKNTGETYILATEKIKDYYKNDKDYSLVREYKGTCLEGIKYEPIFPDFKVKLEDLKEDLGSSIKLGKNAYSVIIGHHVTTESGTGIVHIAPAYGEDDFIIGEKNELGFVSHIDDSGKVSNTLSDNGKYVFDYNDDAITELKNRGDIFKISTIDHSYPHCWRCDTPLIYRGISAWYVAVEKIRDKMIANNQKINWTPDIIKNGRFGKWLEGARDWNISRNRYWGSAIPVWQSEDKKTEVCIGSIEEMYELNKDFGDITKVIICRHGRTDYNDLGLFDYEDKAKLNEIGKKQAQELKEILKSEKIDAIFSSPLTRCKDTISPLAEKNGLEINIVEDFIEINSPELQDKEFSCKNFKWENNYGNGESVKEVYERIEKAFKKIIKENKGKTIVICSHGDPTVLMKKIIKNYDYDTEKYTKAGYLENNPKKGGIENMFSKEYIYTKTLQKVDIHKHFVDEIFLKDEKNFVAKNVLGIHGMRSDINTGNWEKRKKIIEKHGLNIELFQFDKSTDPTYESWEKTFKTIDFSKYDAILTNSYGGQATVKYLLENNIKVKRLVMTVPGISVNTENGKYVNTMKLWESLKNKDLTKVADEITVIHAKDDEQVLFKNGEKFARETGATFIGLEKGGHGIFEHYELIAGIVKHGTPLKRIPEVLDCWFESGAMPYASKHYPFENSDNFKFPADFIAEGLDQTRGWFYTLLILGTALFDNTPFLNVIVNGIILAEDGKKMSKSLKNYPDPNLVFEKYGADALRFYLMNSVVVEAQEFRFSEDGVQEVVKKVILPLWNTYYFFITYANIDNFTPSPSKERAGVRANPLDKWLISELNILTKQVSSGFDNYRLNNTTRPIVKFMDNLTNWYIRRSRKRFWKSENDGDKMEAYETLNFVLIELSKIIAPFMPFLAENIFKNLTKNQSVHLENFPEFDEKLINEKLSDDMKQTQNFITLGLSARASAKIRVRQPLSYVKIGNDLEDYYKEILKEELNVKEIKIFEESEMPKKICKPNGRAIGPKFGKNVKFIMQEAKSGNFVELENGNIKVGDFELEIGDFEIVFEANTDAKNSEEIIESGFKTAVAINTELTEELKEEGMARDIVRQIQEARKEAKYNVDDRIQVSLSGKNIEKIIENFGKYISNETLSKFNNNLENPDLEKEIELEGMKINLTLKK